MLEELALKYYETREEEYLSKVLELCKGRIIKKISSYGLFRFKEDIIQLANIEIWKSFFYFDPEVGDFGALVNTIIKRAVISFIKWLNRERTTLDREASSLSTIVYENESGALELQSCIPDKDTNLEEDLIDSYENTRLFSKLYDRLSFMEKKVFTAFIKFWGTGTCSIRNYEDIGKVTGYSIKQVDNTLQRIRDKASLCE